MLLTKIKPQVSTLGHANVLNLSWSDASSWAQAVIVNLVGRPDEDAVVSCQ